MKLKNEPKRHRFWSKIQFFFPRMIRVLTSSKLKSHLSRYLNVLFVRHSSPQKRQRQRVEQKKRAHAWVPFPIQIVIKAEATNFTCAGERLTFPTPSEISVFARVPSFLFRVWLAIGIGISSLHPSHLSWTIRTALSHRVKKNWTPVILTFHHPPKCEKCIVFCTDRSCCRTTKAKLRAKGRKLCIEIPTNHHLTTIFCCWKRKENSATFSTDYTKLHRHTLEKKNKLYQHQSEKQNCWKTFFFFNVSFDFRVRASKQAATTYFLRIPNSLFNL